MPQPFVLVAPATRGLSLALARHFLRTTNMPVYATHRSGSADENHKHIMSTLSSDVDGARLRLLKLDLTNEASIADAASALAHNFPGGNDDNGSVSYLHTGFFTGGILAPEKHSNDLDDTNMKMSFQINVLSHLLLIKHFAKFLPSARTKLASGPAKWVHVSARVGSISDNHKGGWYSYRASKAALNQVIRTFDNQLKMHSTPSICVGVHPGTVKTELSKDYWDSVPKDQLFKPEYSAERLAEVVANMKEEQRGRVWDYAGREVPW